MVEIPYIYIYLLSRPKMINVILKYSFGIVYEVENNKNYLEFMHFD